MLTTTPPDMPSEMRSFPDFSNISEAFHLFNEFILRVLHLNELHHSSSKLVLGYQQALEKLRQPPLDESSSVVKDILKSISSSRVTSYQELGCCHLQSNQQTLVKLNEFLKGLKDHIQNARTLLNELEKLVEKVTAVMDADLEFFAAKNLVNLHLEEHDEDVKQMPSCKEPCKEPSILASWQPLDYAMLMTSIFTMLEKDLQMQELVVSDLSLNVDSESLQTYAQMWSLRPFVDEMVLQRALQSVHK